MRGLSRREPSSATGIEGYKEPVDSAVDSSDQDYTQYPPGSVEYFLCMPEVQQITAEMESNTPISSIAESITSSELNDFMGNAVFGRQLKRTAIRHPLVDQISETSGAAAQFLASTDRLTAGDEAARYELLSELWSSSRARSSSLKDIILPLLYGAASDLEIPMRIYGNASNELNNRLVREIGSDEGSKYELAKLISGVATVKEEEQPQATWLVRLLSYPLEGSIIKTVQAELSSGQYSPMLAYEALTATEPHISIRNMLELVSLAGEIGPDTYRRLAMSTDRWPKDASVVLNNGQSQLMADLKSSTEKAKKELAYELGIELNGRSPEDRLLSSLQKLSEAASSNGLGNTLAAVTRKRIGSQGVKAVVEKPTPVPAEVVKQINNTLTFVDKRGVVSPQDSDRFQSLIDDFLSKYKGTKDLPADIDMALQYLKSLDFSQPQKIGIDRVNSGDWVIQTDKGPQSRPFFRWKPRAAAGFPLKTKVLSEHRVLFTLLDGQTIGVVGIVSRKDLNLFLKNAPLNTKSGARR